MTICIICNKEFEKNSHNQIYCSKQCKIKADIIADKNKEHNCVYHICNKTFYKKPAHIKNCNNLFCSPQCKGKHFKIKYIGKNNTFYGKKHSKKSKQRPKDMGTKISLSLKKDPERLRLQGLRLAKSNIGKKFPKRCGAKNPMYGQTELARKGFLAMKKNQKVTKYMYKEIAIKSTYEVKFAQFLDKHNINWLYEPRHFVCGNNHWYYPDFYLPEFNQFIEVKGYKSKVGMAKFNYAKERYKQFTFELIDQDNLKELGIIA